MTATAYQTAKVQYYNSQNNLREAQKAEIIEITRDAFSRPPWNYSPLELQTQRIASAIEYAHSMPTATVITVESGDKILGYRLVLNMDDVVAHSSPSLKPLLNELSEKIPAFPKNISYTEVLAVNPTHHNNGVGSKLIDAHIAYAAANGHDFILGWTKPGSSVMITRYEARGYKPLEGMKVRNGISIDSSPSRRGFVIDPDSSGQAIFYLKDLRPLREAARA